jgi:hypothetical protein
MSSAHTYGKSALNDSSRRSYISTSPFNDNIFSYAISINSSLVNVGTLTVLPGATASNCPAGRILRETGKKLYPDANPSVNTYMVSVFDPISCLTGFIDPNSPLFAVFSTDRPNFIIDAVDPGPGGLKDAGPPVYTNGIVKAGTTIDAGTSITAGTSVTAGTTVTAGTSITAGTTLTVGTTIQSGTGFLSLAGQNRVSLRTTINAPSNGNYTIDASLGQVFYVNITGTTTNIGLVGSNTALTGSQVYIFVKNNGSSTTAVTFGLNMMEAVGGAVSILTTQYYSFMFVSDGTKLVEISRTNVNLL